MDQSNLLENRVRLNNKSRARLKENQEKRGTYESLYALYEGQELPLHTVQKMKFGINDFFSKCVNDFVLTIS